MSDSIVTIFLDTFRELHPATPPPPMSVRFFPFANVNNTIRLREGRLLVRLSDLLEGAPEQVLRAIAHILIAKMYRKAIEPALSSCYRKYILSSVSTEESSPDTSAARTKTAGLRAGFLLRLWTRSSRA